MPLNIKRNIIQRKLYQKRIQRLCIKRHYRIQCFILYIPHFLFQINTEIFAEFSWLNRIFAEMERKNVIAISV